MAIGPGLSLEEVQAIMDEACDAHFKAGRREGLEAGLERARGYCSWPQSIFLIKDLLHVQATGTLPGEAADG